MNTAPEEVSVLEKSRALLRDIVERESLLDARVSVLAKPLTPEEAIGNPGRREFPIITGKERVIEATVLEAKGHAFTDLNADNIDRFQFGVEMWDGNKRTQDLIDCSDVLVITGTTLVNGTFDDIYRRTRTAGKPCLVYGVTAAGASELLGVERICPRGR